MTFSINEDAFSIDPTTGTLFTTEGFDPEVGAYEFRVTVVDPGTLSATAGIVVLVGEGAGLPDLRPR